MQNQRNERYGYYKKSSMGLNKIINIPLCTESHQTGQENRNSPSQIWKSFSKENKLSQTSGPNNEDHRSVVANERGWEKVIPPTKESPYMEGPWVTEKKTEPQPNIRAPAGRLHIFGMIEIHLVCSLTNRKIMTEKNPVIS
jgi:hypothetical protein